jgi:hypothetical protein
MLALLYDAAVGSPLEGKKKILINLYYREIRGSVIATDEMVRECSEKWDCRRSPLHIY